jgi:hypothetical protein
MFVAVRAIPVIPIQEYSPRLDEHLPIPWVPMQDNLEEWCSALTRLQDHVDYVGESTISRAAAAAVFARRDPELFDKVLIAMEAPGRARQPL